MKGSEWKGIMLELHAGWVTHTQIYFEVNNNSEVFTRVINVCVCVCVFQEFPKSFMESLRGLEKVKGQTEWRLKLEDN